MTKKRRGLALTPGERQEVATLLEAMRAELTDTARDARADLAELLELWDEVIGDMGASLPAGAQAQSSQSNQPQPQPAPTGLETMSRADVAKLLKASVSTVQRMEDDNRLPKALKTGPRSRRHLVSDVTALIERLKAGRELDAQRRGRGRLN